MVGRIRFAVPSLASQTVVDIAGILPARKRARNNLLHVVGVSNNQGHLKWTPKQGPQFIETALLLYHTILYHTIIYYTIAYHALIRILMFMRSVGPQNRTRNCPREMLEAARTPSP